MDIKNQLLVIFCCYVLCISFLRFFLYGIKRYQLNNSAYKKRKKGETFKEWLLYSRYKEEIPKILRILYFTVLLIHPLCQIVCLLIRNVKLQFNLGAIIATNVVIFDCVWMTIISLLFWSPRRGDVYDRWITKRRGQKRGKK